MPSGPVRINSSPGLTGGFLTSRLATLAIRYPRLDIDVAPPLRSVRLERHEADIAILSKAAGRRCRRSPRSHRGVRLLWHGRDLSLGGSGGGSILHRLQRGRCASGPCRLASQTFPVSTHRFLCQGPVPPVHSSSDGSPTCAHSSLHRPERSAATSLRSRAVPSPIGVFLLTRSRDRKNPSIRIIAEEVVAMFHLERKLFL